MLLLAGQCTHIMGGSLGPDQSRRGPEGPSAELVLSQKLLEDAISGTTGPEGHAGARTLGRGASDSGKSLCRLHISDQDTC